MKFEKLHIEAFCKASHDVNPLHIDADYAQRSQFGRPVVYGMATVLYALGYWADGRSFRLSNLQASFQKALYEGEIYDLTMDQSSKGIMIRFRKGPVDYAVIKFNAELVADPPRWSEQSYLHFEPLSEANALPQASSGPIDYVMNIGAMDLLQEAFRLGPDSMPADQLATLLYTSYQVGMVLPGRQALYSELKIEFASVDLHIPKVELQLESVEFDERFNRHTIKGQGPGVNLLRIVAFQRPPPVNLFLNAMPRFENGKLPLHNKVVFISGATRGFGAAMARMCALAGARLALNYRTDQKAAEVLVDELTGIGTNAQTFVADMSDVKAVSEMATMIADKVGQIDIIVNNAAPPIRELRFLEQDNTDILHFFTQNLSITLETARQLLPLLSKSGQFMHVSTKYLTEPQRGFSHYLTVKAAEEALIKALSLEYSGNEFVVARLPRILTDQTNIPFDFHPPRHPGEVAKEAILELVRQKSSENYRAIELSNKDG